MVANSSVRCPLSLCNQSHELRTDRSGNAYIACGSWKLSVWFRGLGAQFLNQNGGAVPSRENPGRTVQSYGPAVEGGDDGERPETLPVRPNPSPNPDLFDQLQATILERQRLAVAPRGRCGSCGEPCEINSPSCNSCGQSLTWE